MTVLVSNDTQQRLQQVFYRCHSMLEGASHVHTFVDRLDLLLHPIRLESKNSHLRLRALTAPLQTRWPAGGGFRGTAGGAAGEPDGGSRRNQQCNFLTEPQSLLHKQTWNPLVSKHLFRQYGV